MLNDEITGNVFNIEKYHIHDGEGIRTAVFLKGCHLKCPWCANPESQSREKQLVVHAKLCNTCLMCESVCPKRAVYHLDSHILLNENLCDYCGKCIEMCPAAAREIYGKEMTVRQVIQQVMKDAAYYSRSGGGITITGGEPLMQEEFTRALLEACRKEYILSAVETCGIAPWETVWKALEPADEILLDIKTANPAQAIVFMKQANGQDVIRTLRHNIEGLRREGKDIVFRCPIIPGFNYSARHIGEVISWAKEYGVKRIDLLPYHELGRYKYAALKLAYPYRQYKALKDSDLFEFRSAVLANRIECEIGG